jgi:hypothetical protein
VAEVESFLLRVLEQLEDLEVVEVLLMVVVVPEILHQCHHHKEILEEPVVQDLLVLVGVEVVELEVPEVIPVLLAQ